MTKSTQLKELLNSAETEFLMEAHDGISAKIVEEAGFKGIWASGLALSTALGVRDSNEASWTQVLEMLEFWQIVFGEMMMGKWNCKLMKYTRAYYRNINNLK